MVSVNAPNRESLRSRRRRETEREIHLAALHLARAHGFDKVTVEMISAEAGVSPRTFFNYFPNKDAAIVQGPAELSEELAAEFVSAGPAPAKQVLTELTRLLTRDFSEHPPQREEVHAAFELAREHPQVLAVLLARFDAFAVHIADLVGRRLGEEAGDEVPALMAAIALAAVRQGLDRWARASDDGSPVPYVERSMDLLRTLLAP
ncbi:TetR/AcrR family transcriptional regulator [Amycolatopsis mediterranei]|nr:TetR family transcriptional regulator [Amycolatopsis mediterranei]UZF72426.1 TetR/AcrR family transcriptional regulator [Amycolatopsis mediterranei]